MHPRNVSVPYFLTKDWVWFFGYEHMYIFHWKILHSPGSYTFLMETWSIPDVDSWQYVSKTETGIRWPDSSFTWRIRSLLYFFWYPSPEVLWSSVCSRWVSYPPVTFHGSTPRRRLLGCLPGFFLGQNSYIVLMPRISENFSCNCFILIGCKEKDYPLLSHSLILMV